MQFIIHPGCPRTGTTTLQKDVFKNARNTLILQKKPYESTFTKRQLSGALEIEHDTFSQIIEYCRQASIPSREINSSFAIRTINDICAKHENILLSTERLVDTGASLSCLSTHRKNITHIYPIYPLIEIIKKAGQIPLISICLRDSIQYLKSKYMRTVVQRQAIKERFLKPCEFIQKQSALEQTAPGTSALMPAMHSEFIGQLQQHTFVKAFGFQELVHSKDIFSLMGLQGQDKYSFQDFQVRNKLPLTKEQGKAIEEEIINSLKQCGLYKRIMRSQMFY